MEMYDIVVISVISSQNGKEVSRDIEDAVHGDVRYSCDLCDCKAT